jgi:hypothetical protein
MVVTGHHQLICRSYLVGCGLLQVNRFSIFHRILIAGAVLAVIGWGGLGLLLTTTLPTLGPKWLLFFLIVLAMSGTSLPVVYLLNRRFSKRWPVPVKVMARQATWFGVYGSLVAWLQIGRVLDANRALFIAAGLAGIEWMIRTYERSRWEPEEPKDG